MKRALLSSVVALSLAASVSALAGKPTTGNQLTLCSAFTLGNPDPRAGAGQNPSPVHKISDNGTATATGAVFEGDRSCGEGDFSQGSEDSSGDTFVWQVDHGTSKEERPGKGNGQGRGKGYLGTEHGTWQIVSGGGSPTFGPHAGRFNGRYTLYDADPQATASGPVIESAGNFNTTRNGDGAVNASHWVGAYGATIEFECVSNDQTDAEGNADPDCTPEDDDPNTEENEDDDDVQDWTIEVHLTYRQN